MQAHFLHEKHQVQLLSLSLFFSFLNKSLAVSVITIFFILGRGQEEDNKATWLCGHVCTNNSYFTLSYCCCCCSFCGLRLQERYFYFRENDLIGKMGKAFRFVSFLSAVAVRLVKDVSSLNKSVFSDSISTD